METLELPQRTKDDPFNLIFDLSEKYPNSTIVVDEILLEDLEKLNKSMQMSSRVDSGLALHPKPSMTSSCKRTKPYHSLRTYQQ